MQEGKEMIRWWTQKKKKSCTRGKRNKLPKNRRQRKLKNIGKEGECYKGGERGDTGNKQQNATRKRE
jgi:hypothetical protein